MEIDDLNPVSLKILSQTELMSELFVLATETEISATEMHGPP